MQDAVLEFKGIAKSFGGVRVLRDFDLSVSPGLITALVGPNGAGKTTLFNIASGFLRADAGEVLYRGQSIDTRSPYKIGRLGIGRSFQEMRLFERMSVKANITSALDPRTLSLRRTDRSMVQDVLAQVGLPRHGRGEARDLSYAERKSLALGRLIGSGSDVLLLDEPTSGLDERSLHQTARTLRQFRDDGLTILIIEHNLDLVREIADKVAFLAEGSVMAYGATEDILTRDDLATLYFGEALK